MVTALETKDADAPLSTPKYSAISGVKVEPAIQLTAKNAYVKNKIASITYDLLESCLTFDT